MCRKSAHQNSIYSILRFISLDRPNQLFHQSDTLDDANWKLLTETLLEGYNIKSLHRESFYPFSLDNVNVVE